jgi:hypothetical protein
VPEAWPRKVAASLFALVTLPSLDSMRVALGMAAMVWRG